MGEFRKTEPSPASNDPQLLTGRINRREVGGGTNRNGTEPLGTQQPFPADPNGGPSEGGQGPALTPGEGRWGRGAADARRGTRSNRIRTHDEKRPEPSNPDGEEEREMWTCSHVEGRTACPRERRWTLWGRRPERRRGAGRCLISRAVREMPTQRSGPMGSGERELRCQPSWLRNALGSLSRLGAGREGGRPASSVVGPSRGCAGWWGPQEVGAGCGWGPEGPGSVGRAAGAELGSPERRGQSRAGRPFLAPPWTPRARGSGVARPCARVTLRGVTRGDPPVCPWNQD